MENKDSLSTEISWNAYMVKKTVRALREVNNQNLKSILETARDLILEKMQEQMHEAEGMGIDVPMQDFHEAELQAYKSMKEEYELALNGADDILVLDENPIPPNELRSFITSLDEIIEYIEARLLNL